jgi:hypothetical protein
MDALTLLTPTARISYKQKVPNFNDKAKHQ